jgi:DNA-directed RNA polymerase specialized sigma24 family protein
MQSGPGSEEFALLTDQFRPELLVHCYRMLGSVQDAEDQVQETLLRPESADPAAVVAARSGLRLALIAALQRLPVRQRTVLILRDVLGWRAAEVAELLGTSATAVNSALQRAREELRQEVPAPDKIREPSSQADAAVLDRAFGLPPEQPAADPPPADPPAAEPPVVPGR